MFSLSVTNAGITAERVFLDHFSVQRKSKSKSSNTFYYSFGNKYASITKLGGHTVCPPSFVILGRKCTLATSRAAPW